MVLFWRKQWLFCQIALSFIPIAAIWQVFISIPSPFKPFPCFLFQEQRWWSFQRRQGNCTNAMHASPQSSFGRVVEHSCGACRHHTPFQRRDIQEGLQNGQGCSLFSEDEPCSSPPGGHPWPSFQTRAYGTLLTSLFFSSPNASMLAHVALPSCQTEGGYWAGERGLLSTAQVQCGKNGGFDVFLLGYIYLYILLLCYIAICLYIYIGIALFIYCTFGHIRYFIFK